MSKQIVEKHPAGRARTAKKGHKFAEDQGVRYFKAITISNYTES